MSHSPHEEKSAPSSYLAQTHVHKTETTGNGVHKTILSTWTEVKTPQKRQNGIQLWGTASNSNIEILEHFQSEDLCMIVDASWYDPNTVFRKDFQTPTKEEIRHYSPQYSVRLSVHPNDFVVKIKAQLDHRRLRKHLPNNLPTRF
jgi:hypothetical protein